MAERKGFEPLIPLTVYTLSKRAPSTTRPPLRFFINYNFLLLNNLYCIIGILYLLNSDENRKKN